MTTYFYAIYDENPTSAINIHLSEADSYNKRGYGIFYAVQQLKSKERKKYNVDYIRCLAIDIDNKGQSKKEMIDSIKSSPLTPTIVNETKNGFHVYYILRRDKWIKVDNESHGRYKNFMKSRLVPFFKSDDKALDLTRLLRVPYFYHLKDKENPFLVKPVFTSAKLYDMETIKSHFPVINKSVPNPKPVMNYDTKNPGVDSLKKSINILDLARQLGVTIDNRGCRTKIKCVFDPHRHSDKNGSLVFYPETNTFYCFGCNKGGSVIDFYNEYKKINSIGKSIDQLKRRVANG